MNKTEKILAVLVFVALVMKYLKVPFNGILLVIALNTLAILYYPFGFALFNNVRLRKVLKKTSYVKTNKKRLVGAFGIGVGMAVLLIGTLFKVQLWPNAHFMLLSGLVVTFPGLIISAFFYSRNQEEFYKRILGRTILWGVLGIAAYSISDDVLIEHYYSDRSQEYRELTKALHDDPGNTDLRSKLMELDKLN